MKMILNIEPKPQTRPRFSKFGTYEDPKMKAWRRQCSQLIEQEYNGQFFDGPISVSVTFYMKAPLSVSKKPTPRARAKTWDMFKRFMSETLWHAVRPDLDNLVKALFDSISNAGYNKLIKRVSSGRMTVLYASLRHRNDIATIHAICNEINDLMNVFNLTFEQALEVVKLSVTICDYDVKDEQLAGFGELLEEFINQWSLPNAKMDN